MKAVVNRPLHGVGEASRHLDEVGDENERPEHREARNERREIREQNLAPGEHAASWDGATSAGTRAAAGLYFVRLASAGRITAARFVLVH